MRPTLRCRLWRQEAEAVLVGLETSWKAGKGPRQALFLQDDQGLRRIGRSGKPEDLDGRGNSGF